MDHPVHARGIQCNISQLYTKERKMLFSVSSNAYHLSHSQVVRLCRFHKNYTVNKIPNCIKTSCKIPLHAYVRHIYFS